MSRLKYFILTYTNQTVRYLHHTGLILAHLEYFHEKWTFSSSVIYLSPNKPVIAAKSHRAAELKLVTVPLTVDGNSGIVTFVLSES